MQDYEWLPLLFAWHKGKKAHQYENLRTADDVYNGVRQRRKAYLGTWLSLEAVVQPHGRPDYDNINALTQYLSANAEEFRKRSNPEADSLDVFENFFFFGIAMFAHYSIMEECFDDLILLAECFEGSLDVFRFVMEDNLPTDLVQDALDWVDELDKAPFHFSRYVTAAIASLLGALPSCA